jgi:phosphatidylserine/phosphatidylglycerophosphate/cardiolipin synthase-like enzyme
MDQLILTPGMRRQTFIDLLRSAKHRVMLSLFRCDDSRVLDEIITTSRRGVDVQVLITPRAKGWNKRLGSLVTLLSGTGVTVKQYAGPFSKYHAKYVVVDGEIGMIGSANLTRKCFDDTCDFVLLTRQADLVSDLGDLFDADWNAESRPPQKCGRLIVGPIDMHDRIIEYLKRARSRIRIIDHRVSHPSILLLLNRKMNEGVHVQVLGRGEVGMLASHGKMMIVDSDLALIGSASLSRPGMDVRREVSVAIEEPPLIKQLSEFFEAIVAENAAKPNEPRNTQIPDDDEEDDAE